MKKIIIGAAVAALAFTSAVAKDVQLTTEQARKFAQSLFTSEQLAEKLEAAGYEDVLEEDSTMESITAGTMYSDAISRMKKDNPGAYKIVERYAKKSGFKNAAEYASVGDKTMRAYMAIKTGEEGAVQLREMDAEERAMMQMMMSGQLPPEMQQMKDMLPPEVFEQMTKGVAMAQSMQNAPEADKEAVRPVVPLMDEAIEKSAENAAEDEDFSAQGFQQMLESMGGQQN